MEYKTYNDYPFRFLKYIKDAIAEDLPDGDITCQSIGLESKKGKAKLIAKEDLVLSGLDIFLEVFLYIDPDIAFRFHFQDGDRVLKGQIICEIKGNLVSCLKAERTALNFLGMFSGIASYSRCFVDMLAGSSTKILDTRKTIPLYRELSKKAVKDGGAKNHRKNLSDAVLVKENHIEASGSSINKIVKSIRSNYAGPIEIEVRNLEELKEAVNAGVERVMLDNMSNEILKEALKIIPPNIESEASGNMTLERVKSLANYGLNYISVGALTHSAPVADMSLLFIWE